MLWTRFGAHYTSHVLGLRLRTYFLLICQYCNLLQDSIALQVMDSNSMEPSQYYNLLQDSIALQVMDSNSMEPS